MQSTRTKYLLLVLLVLLAVVAAVVMRGGGKVKPTPSVSGYYTGPMRNKSDPTIYSTEDGRRVAPPPGAATSSSWAPVKVSKEGRIGAD